MNFVFVSPQFPSVYWRFCAALRRDGACVLGIGDTPYDQLAQEVKDSLDEYYWVSSLEDYDQVFRAVAFFSFKYGKIDWIESNNEHWLAQDARLREDFNVLTGPRPLSSGPLAEQGGAEAPLRRGGGPDRAPGPPHLF